jgi:DNA-binding transcriptional LysR family regulator
VRGSINDLSAFIAVATDRSFTRAAARLGMSQSSLSRVIRKLEENLGVRLLTRTTRSVAPTDAGERLLAAVAPRFEEIEAELEALSDQHGRPAGTIRITAAEHSANTVLWPKLAAFLPSYPDIKVEVSTEGALVDIVTQRFDAGVRLGEQVAKDMIAVRIGPDWRFAVVAAPAYFSTRPRPSIPQELTQHACINLRLATRGGLYAWEFKKDGRALNVHVDGQLIFTSSAQMLRAALAGFGIACVPEDMALPHIEQGELVRILEDWCAPFEGYHLYYPSRRQASPAFALLVEALRYRTP